MAQKKWRQVKVKVKGRMVTRWTDGSGNYRLAKPAATGAGVLSNTLRSVHNALGGNRGPSAGWRAAAEEQRKPRRSDGQLSPRPSKAQSKTTAIPKSTPTKPPLKTILAKDRPKDMQAGKVYGDAGQPPAPTLPPKPTPTKSAPTKSAPTRKPQSKDMDANYKAWAKANPGLAKKVKKGQSGYKAINSSSSRAAKPSDARDLRSGPTPPKNRTTLKVKPTATRKRK